MGLNTEKRSPRAHVGSTVGVKFGETVLPATVVEDRGTLGPGGQRLVRVSVNATPSATTTFEVLFDTLLPAPKIVKRMRRSSHSRPKRHRTKQTS